MIVEAGAPHPTPLSTSTTASMDTGAGNTGNTWFEAGYDTFLPTNGLPQANTTITSANQADHHYKMPPSYAANDALMLDGSFTTGNLTPATPASFSALAFLTASAGGDVLINALVQHQDGSAESLSFTARDWFNNSPVAYNVNGRINLNTRALTDENSTPLNPRLYEPQIALANTVSPVTNIAMTYAGSGTPRATIFAMSGTAGAVPPIIDASPSSVITYEGPDETFTATISGGTPPLTYRWQKGTNGVFANLSDGGNITGATTTSLTVHTVGLSDAADYRLAVSNVAGSVNSGVATLTVLSSLPDVTAPGDAITPFGGTSPVGEEVTHAIDNLTSKYLNFGQNTTPFGGPVGLIVTPAMGASRVNVMRIYTANDFPERDPADYTLEGSNDGGSSYTVISSGPLALPSDRNNGGFAVDPLTQPMQQVSFANGAGYTTYRLSFTHVKNAAGANSCQIGEVELLGVPSDLNVSVTPTFLNVYPGNSAQFNGNVSPIDPSTTYRWQRSTNGTYVNLQDGANVTGSTTATLNLNNVSFADAGTYVLMVSNNTSFAGSAPALLNVLSTLNDVTAPLDTITIYNGSSPAAEVVSNAIDNTTGKYLNYGTSGTQLPPFVGPAGLIVTPGSGVTVVTGLRMYTANDTPDRDPAGFKLEGSNNGGTTWSLITSNALTLPFDRNAAGIPLDPVALPNQEVRFNNSQGYRAYRLSVNTVRNNAAANSLQFGEIELLGRVTAVMSVVANSNGSLTITSSAPGQLQSTTSLNGSPVWTDAGPINGQVTIFPSPGEPQKFYRVLLQ